MYRIFRNIIILVLLSTGVMAHAEVITASWYSVESCKREGTWQKYGGKMANGKVFDDKLMVCASWDYDFGTRLRITNMANDNAVDVVVSDRGPSKRLWRKGRKIDLAKGAFSKIASLKRGVISIKIEVLT